MCWCRWNEPADHICRNAEIWNEEPETWWTTKYKIMLIISAIMYFMLLSVLFLCYRKHIKEIKELHRLSVLQIASRIPEKAEV